MATDYLACPWFEDPENPGVILAETPEGRVTILTVDHWRDLELDDATASRIAGRVVELHNRMLEAARG